MNTYLHNIFIVSTIDFSKKSAATTRMYHYAKALADDITKVYLISSCSSKLSESHFIEIAFNVFVLEKKRTTINFWATFLFIKRLYHFSNYKDGSKTIILYPSTFVFTEIWTMLYLKAYKKYPVFYELNEVRKYASSYEAPMTFYRVQYSIKKIIFNIICSCVEPLLRFYDGLICISTEIEHYGRRYNKNTMRVPILTDPDLRVEISKKEYFTKGSFNIGFSGSIHPIKEDLDNFISIIEKLKLRGYPVSFNLCGGIFKTYKKAFLRLCDLCGELNYYGYLDEREMSTFLSQQELMVLPRGYTLQNKYGFSTKLSDYLNHGRMTLVTDVSDNSLYIKDGINGFIVPPNDAESMYKKIEYIMLNFSELEKKIIPNAIKTVQNDFNYRLFGKPMKKFLLKAPNA